ncbi:transmembrane protein 145-like isoform X1 [Ischnura elegans]|uniref:transmembrane protein 145-like isoform X1 n=1 Tax=Ischnura elegans TaxID=197161 RepID=UPI001ED89A0F|nr:transmembrane protein 145-like isoform X1 [Ischnura elegans]
MASVKQLKADSWCLAKITYAWCVLLIISYNFSTVCSTHLTGTWNTSEFFHFLIKFGFQKTDIHSDKDSLGYIFGNITSNTNFTNPVTFAVLDRGYFLEYYGNRSVADKDKACALMFNKISTIAYDVNCYDAGEDFLRRVPCPLGKVCPDEDNPNNVIKGNQFTYVIRDMAQPRFWYISLVACYRNKTTCEWHHTKEDFSVDYDIWLVNGNPNASHHNPLEYQFSFDHQNTLEISLVFLVVYLGLAPLQFFASLRQQHPVTRLFAVSLALELSSLLLSTIHLTKFAFDGVGLSSLALAGDILDILSRTLFMLLLLLLAKGWAITRLQLTWKPLVFSIWLLYGVVHILLYVWNMTEVDIIEDIDEYQTWPGWLVVVFRTLISIWFLLELRTTMLYEHNAQKLHFFLHFGASALVWFIYLPIVALVALQVSALWRFKLLLGITYSADCMAFCVMTHLLWPTRSEQYLLLLPADMGYHGDELEEFNEAPHILHKSNYLSSGGNHAYSNGATPSHPAPPSTPSSPALPVRVDHSLVAVQT